MATDSYWPKVKIIVVRFGPLVLSQSSKEFAPQQSVGKGNVTIMAIVSKTWRDIAGKLTIKSIGYNNF